MLPWIGPFSLEAKPLDGNVSNQTLYDESWIGGATRWNWRAESGDWRFLTVEWPEEWDTGGTAILDVDWDDNPYTDIDVLWLTETRIIIQKTTRLLRRLYFSQLNLARQTITPKDHTIGALSLILRVRCSQYRPIRVYTN